MPKIHSRFDRPGTIPSSLGSIYKKVFEERIVDGCKKLVEVGKENLKDFIEASKNETLITSIMRRFEMGDTSVLSKVQGFYGDVTGMPSSLADAQNILIRLHKQFDSLPVDTRRKFDNSFDKFVKDVSFTSVENFSEIFGFKSAPSDAPDVKISESEVE